MAHDRLINRLLDGRAHAGPDLTVHLSDRDGPSLHDKMRPAYWWIVNNAILRLASISQASSSTTRDLRQKRFALASTCLLADRLAASSARPR